MRNPNLAFNQALYPKSRSTIKGNRVLLLSHSAETPDKPGIAASLARGWWQNPANQTSVHNMTDRSQSVQIYEYPFQTWGCGNGNAYTFQFEHAGYARWSKAEWRTPTMMQVIRNSAQAQAWVWHTYAMKQKGITYYPEWLSLTEIAAGSKSGLLTHNDARLVWKGTTHTDPGPNFPYIELRNMIHEELDILTGNKAKPQPPTAPIGKVSTYTVVKGDTLYGIASKFHTTPAELSRLNSIIKNPGRLSIGWKLRIPTATTVTPSVPPNPKPAPVKRYTPPPSAAFPLPRGEYFGDIKGPAKSHGGYYTSERKYVKWIQIRMQEMRYAPADGSWADGKYEAPTTIAVAKWQRARHAATTSRPGEVWSDDWANLQKDR